MSHAAIPESEKLLTIPRNRCSRSPEIRAHDRLKSLLTIARNAQVEGEIEITLDRIACVDGAAHGLGDYRLHDLPSPSCNEPWRAGK
jgi:hypothetical protein